MTNEQDHELLLHRIQDLEDFAEEVLDALGAVQGAGDGSRLQASLDDIGCALRERREAYNHKVLSFSRCKPGDSEVPK